MLMIQLCFIGQWEKYFVQSCWQSMVKGEK